MRNGSHDLGRIPAIFSLGSYSKDDRMRRRRCLANTRLGIQFPVEVGDIVTDLGQVLFTQTQKLEEAASYFIMKK